VASDDNQAEESDIPSAASAQNISKKQLEFKGYH